MTEIADTLDLAADALWMYGRAKGCGVRPDGSMCVRGAIQYAAGNDPAKAMCVTDNPAITAFDAYLAAHPDLLTERHRTSSYFKERIAAGTFPAWLWSDCQDDDAFIVDTLRHAAKDLRNGVA